MARAAKKQGKLQQLRASKNGSIGNLRVALDIIFIGVGHVVLLVGRPIVD
jgi:hypothetical protein